MRITALRALGLGDLLTAVPSLRALRTAFPDARLVLACPAALHELVDAWALAHPVAAAPLAPLPSRVHAADVAVNLHGRGPESTRVLLATEPRRLVAFEHAAIPETAGLPEWRPVEHEVERWCRLLVECGIPAPPDRLDLPAPPIAAWLSGVEGSTVLHPGAAAPARRWPGERWAEIARRELERGRRVLVTGSSDERDECERIAAAAGIRDDDVLAGRTSLLELAAIVARAGTLLSGDTGAAHLATAFGTPSLVLFGPVPPCEWGPPSGRSRHRALWAGRRGDPHGLVPDPGLLELSTARVARELEDLRADVGATSRASARARDRAGAKQALEAPPLSRPTSDARPRDAQPLR